MANSNSIENAFQICGEIARHYENFPVASIFIPKEKRKYMAAIYAFARTADDIADEKGLTREERIERLGDMEAKLQRASNGSAQEPIFIALGETITRFGLPVELFQHLLVAFRMDVERKRYASWNELLDYCSHSANPIGRLVLHLFGYGEENRMKQSDAICTALQLTNFWQDLSCDVAEGRIYIPAEDLERFRCTEGDLISKNAKGGLVDLLEFEIGRTSRLFDEGKPLIQSVGNDLRFQLKLTWLAGKKMLGKVERLGGQILFRRPTMKVADRLMVALNALSPGAV